MGANLLVETIIARLGRECAAAAAEPMAGAYPNPWPVPMEGSIAAVYYYGPGPAMGDIAAYREEKLRMLWDRYGLRAWQL